MIYNMSSGMLNLTRLDRKYRNSSPLCRAPHGKMLPT